MNITSRDSFCRMMFIWTLVPAFVLVMGNLTAGGSSLLPETVYEDDSDGSDLESVPESDDEDPFDFLDEPTSPWCDYSNGDEIFEVVNGITSLLEQSEYLVGIYEYPFGTTVDPEEWHLAIGGLVALLGDHLDSNPDASDLIEQIRMNPTMRAWETGISLMLAAGLNDPSFVKDDEFFRVQIELITRLMDIYGDSGTVPEFLVDRLLGDAPLPEQPVSGSLMEVQALIRTIETDPLETRVRQVYDFLRTRDDESVCESEHIPILTLLVEELNKQDPELEVMASTIGLESLRYCAHSLSFGEKRQLLPLRLFKYFPDTVWVPSSGHRLITVEQELEASLLLQQTLDEIGSFRRLGLVRGDVRVAYHDSETKGPAARTSLLSRVIPEAFKPESGLFDFTDERKVFIKPVSDDLVKYRNLGRLIGLAIKRDIPVNGGRFSAGVLSLLQAPRKEVWDLEELLEEEDPLKASTLKNWAREDPSAPVDDMMREIVIESIKSQSLALLRGIYEVIPFGYFSWFSREEIRDILCAPTDINRVELISTLTLEPPSEVPSKTETQLMGWLRQAITEMTQEQIRQFLAFVSGTSLPPLTGFTEPIKVQVQTSAPIVSLPGARVCFSQLDLPPYDSFDLLRDKLLYAIANCSSIDLM